MAAASVALSFLELERTGKETKQGGEAKSFPGSLSCGVCPAVPVSVWDFLSVLHSLQWLCNERRVNMSWSPREQQLREGTPALPFSSFQAVAQMSVWSMALLSHAGPSSPSSSELKAHSLFPGYLLWGWSSSGVKNGKEEGRQSFQVSGLDYVETFHPSSPRNKPRACLCYGAIILMP